MASLKFYNDMISQPVRAVYMLLNAAKIPYESVPTSLFKGEHKKPEYVAKFPTGSVPAIDDGGFTMIESVAILQYLCTKYSVADHWYPKDVQARAKVDMVTHWHHTGIRKAGVGFFISTFLNPVVRKQARDEPRIAESKELMEKSLNYIENHLLKESKFLAGDQISIADLLVISEVMQPLSADYDVTKSRPKIGAWIENVKSALDGVFTKAHEPLFELVAKYKSQS